MNELLIELNVKDRIPIYEQIYFHIREEIGIKRLSEGEKLPSTRKLATYLGVSRSTVELAYAQLQSEGYIETIPWKGYYVSKGTEVYPFGNIMGKDSWEEERKEKEEKEENKETEYLFDFSPYGIDTEYFPTEIWKKLSKEILTKYQGELFSLGNPLGEQELREEIAGYLYRSRGVRADAGQIVVGAGSDYLLMLLWMLLRPNKIAFESPGYTQAYHLFQKLKAQVCSIDMDEFGMKVDELDNSGADLCYVMPSHQYPTGIVMPVARRMELLEWAKVDKNRFILEDDYDSEFRYKGRPIPALQGFDRADKVIYLGTFSKSIAPAIRISFLVLPKSLEQHYKREFGFLNSTVSRLDQLVVAKFLKEGRYERNLNKVRALYKSRHDTLIRGLKPLSDVCTIQGEQAGVHILLTFLKKGKEEQYIRLAKEEGIKVYGISVYETKERGEYPSILLGYANLTEEEIQKAVEILVKIWS